MQQQDRCSSPDQHAAFFLLLLFLGGPKMTPPGFPFSIFCPERTSLDSRNGHYRIACSITTDSRAQMKQNQWNSGRYYRSKDTVAFLPVCRGSCMQSAEEREPAHCCLTPSRQKWSHQRETSRDSLLVERPTRDRKVASSNPGRSGGRFSSSELILCLC